MPVPSLPRIRGDREKFLGVTVAKVVRSIGSVAEKNIWNGWLRDSMSPRNSQVCNGGHYTDDQALTDPTG
jgi:hypothetical protein